MAVAEFHELDIEDFEFVLVNDCSPDGGETLGEIQSLAEKYPYVTAVDLGKNSGQHNATMAALNYATGDYIISMDDDMQTNPSEFPKLLSKLAEGYDVVYGYYEEKKESWFRRMGSALNHWTVRMLIHKPKWLKTSSFWVIRRYVRDYVIQYRYPNVHLQGLFLRTTDNIACVPIEHYERAYGSSTYTLKKLIALYLNIVTFSSVPIHFVSVMGFILAGFGFIIDLYLVIRKIINPAYATGWFSIIGALCFFSGVILAALGVVGAYVGRLMMGQTNDPQYVVRSVTKQNK